MKNRETNEWLKQNQRSSRNFIRKWGHFVKHDTLLKPIIPPKYDIGLVINNCSYTLLHTLEPWCSKIYVDWASKGYVEIEQKETMFDLQKRVYNIEVKKDNDIVVSINGKEFDDTDFHYIQQLPEILANDELEPGVFELGRLSIQINKIKTYEKELINCKP